MKSGKLILGMSAALWIAGGASVRADQPSGETLTPDQMLNELLNPSKPQHTSDTTRPDSQSKVLQPEGHTDGAAAHLLREGSDVVNRSGQLVKKPDSYYSQFVFDNHPGEPPLQPMYILPDLKLVQMENATAATKRDLHFTVSGTLTEYRGNNFILLDIDTEDMNQSMKGDHPPAPTTGPTTPDQMLNDMLTADAKPAARPEPRPRPETDSTSGSGSIAPNAPMLTVLREQSQIVERVGRLSPGTGDGRRRELLLESDGSALQDPPLIILPNLKLAAMESAQDASTRDVRFRVTGMVTEYRGRNYILLEKVVVIPQLAAQF